MNDSIYKVCDGCFGTNERGILYEVIYEDREELASCVIVKHDLNCPTPLRDFFYGIPATSEIEALKVFLEHGGKTMGHKCYRELLVDEMVALLDFNACDEYMEDLLEKFDDWLLENGGSQYSIKEFARLANSSAVVDEARAILSWESALEESNE
jgi:hypothetical protein